MCLYLPDKSFVWLDCSLDLFVNEISAGGLPGYVRAGWIPSPNRMSSQG